MAAVRLTPPPRQALATTPDANAAESPPASSGTQVAEASRVHCWKVSFSSRAEATLTTLKRNSRRGSKHKHTLHPYRCPHCNRWHLTSRAGPLPRR